MKFISISIMSILFFGCSEKPASDNKSVDSANIQTIKTDSVDSQTEKIVTQNLKSNGHYLAIGYYDDKNQLEKVDRFFNGVLISE